MSRSPRSLRLFPGTPPYRLAPAWLVSLGWVHWRHAWWFLCAWWAVLVGGVAFVGLVVLLVWLGGWVVLVVWVGSGVASVVCRR